MPRRHEQWIVAKSILGVKGVYRLKSLLGLTCNGNAIMIDQSIDEQAGKLC
jgi:hypothetical protein